MAKLHESCNTYISENIIDNDIQHALYNYVEFIIQRNR